MTMTPTRARILLVLAYLIGASCTLFIGYELGKATPCTDVESFDIKPLQ